MAVNRLKSWVKFGLGIWYYYYKDDTNKKQRKLLTEFVNQPDSSTSVKTQYQSHPKTKKKYNATKEGRRACPSLRWPRPLPPPARHLYCSTLPLSSKTKREKKNRWPPGWPRHMITPQKKKKKKAHRMLCLVSSSGERKTRLGSGYIAQVEMAFPTADYHPNERLSEVKMRGEKFAYFKLFNCPAVLAVQLFRIY